MHPSLRRRWMRSGAPALAAAVLAFAACAKPVEEVLLVSPGSSILEGLGTMPAGTDASTLFEAREIFRLAHRGDAVAAIDRYLEQRALAALLDAPPPKVATIGDIVNRVPEPDEAAATRAAHARVLRSSLTPQALAPAGLEVAVEVRNASGRLITAFRGALVFERDGKVVAAMQCEQKTPAPVRLAPDAALPHLCSFAIPRREVEGLLREQATATSGWRFEPAFIRFDDPRVMVNAQGTHWDDVEEAGIARARRWLREVGCERRGACKEETWQQLWKHPAAPGIAASAGAGLVVGVLCALFRPRRLRTAIIASAAVLAVAAALAVGAGGSDASGYLVLWLLFYGPVFVVPYLVTLLATLGIVRLLARKEAPARAAATPVE